MTPWKSLNMAVGTYLAAGKALDALHPSVSWWAHTGGRKDDIFAAYRALSDEQREGLRAMNRGILGDGPVRLLLPSERALLPSERGIGPGAVLTDDPQTYVPNTPFTAYDVDPDDILVHYRLPHFGTALSPKRREYILHEHAQPQQVVATDPNQGWDPAALEMFETVVRAVPRDLAQRMEASKGQLHGLFHVPSFLDRWTRQAALRRSTVPIVFEVLDTPSKSKGWARWQAIRMDGNSVMDTATGTVFGSGRIGDTRKTVSLPPGTVVDILVDIELITGKNRRKELTRATVPVVVAPGETFDVREYPGSQGLKLRVTNARRRDA